MQKLLFLLILLVSTICEAQNPFQDFKVEHYDSRKGLPNDYVKNVYQSKEGFLWLNGYSGISRFDGLNFVNFNTRTTSFLQTDNIEIFAETDDSALWFPTNSDGLIEYRKGKFTQHIQDQPNLFYRGMTKSKELILSLGGSGTSEYLVFNIQTKKYRIIKRDQYIRERYYVFNSTDTSLRRWVTNNNILYRLNNQGQLIPVTYKGKSPIDLTFIQFFRDSKGKTWMTSEYGLYYWNGEFMCVFPGMEDSKSIVNNPTFGLIAEDHDKGIWVAAGSGRLNYLPHGSTQFFEFPRGYLNIQTISNITVDREGQIWIASDRGLFKIYKSKVKNFAATEGIENNRVSAVTQTGDSSFMIVNPENKVYSLVKGEIKRIKILENEKFVKVGSTSFHCFTDSKNNQWICCSDLILKISGDKQKIYALGEQTGGIRYAYEASDGKVYFGVSYKGIGFINDKGKFEYVKFPNVDFSQMYISFIREINSKTWLVGTYRTGIYIISKDGSVINDGLFGNVKGIPVFSCITDSADKEVFWFATARGLVKYKNKKKWYIGKNADIPELSLFQIMPDHFGKWWFPTNRGIMYADKKAIDQYLNDSTFKIQWRVLNEGDGMNNRQCVGARHSIVAKDGRLMILSIGGLVEVNPAKITSNSIPPLVTVNGLQVDDKPFYKEGIAAIPPGNHRYIFSYSVLSFMAPEKNQIKFRLSGYDTGWIRSSGDTKAYYTNLPPGKYRFEVIASNNDGVWVIQPATFDLEVGAYFYQTVWFKILLLLLFISGIYSVFQWRLKETQKKNQILQQEVARQTAELRGSLEKLKSTQSQLVQSEKMASLGELTAGIAHEIQNPLNFVNNFAEVNTELIDELKKEIEPSGISSANELIEDIKANSAKITFHGKRADAIVKSMLQHSRKSSGQKELTDINALCDEYLRLSYHGLRAKDKSFNAEFDTQFDNRLEPINVVPQDIGRVILNLINNAFYAVNERQKKDKDSGYKPRVTLTTRQEGKQVVIEVADNGTGMPDQLKEKIFQPFFTTKPTGEGTGLGLSLSYDIVTKGHGGTMDVESAEGLGTRFQVKLPFQV
jgi:signal transduction histidine kinase/ligand-binding sensor domain-containing protein